MSRVSGDLSRGDTGGEAPAARYGLDQLAAMAREQIGEDLAEPLDRDVERVAVAQRVVLARAPGGPVEDVGRDRLAVGIDQAGEQGAGDGPALDHGVARRDGGV